MQELLEKESDSHQVQQETEKEDVNVHSINNQTSSEKSRLPTQAEVKEKMDLVIQELKEHKAFNKQKQLEKGEKTEETSSNETDEETVEVTGRKRSNAFISQPKDRQIQSLIKIRNMVLDAKNSGEFERVHTYIEKEGFLSKLKKDGTGAIKDKVKSVTSGIKTTVFKKGKEALTKDVGSTLRDTVGFIGEKARDVVEGREALYKALKEKKVDQLKELVFSKIGENKFSNVISKAVEWICSTFGGKSDSAISKGLTIIDKLTYWAGPVGSGIESVKSGVETSIKIYKLIKERKDKTKTEIIHDVGDIIESGLETLKNITATVKSALSMFNLFKGAVATVIPIVGSAISIAINAVHIVIRSYDAFRGFYLQWKAHSLINKVASKDSMKVFKREKSSLPDIKFEKMDVKAIKQRKKELKEKLLNEGLSNEEMEEYEDLQSYTLYSDLGTHNKKRGIRSLIIIGEELVSIGAEIANIVGVATQGIGTAVGTAMNVAVTVEKGGRKAYNFIKQLGRDYGPSAIFDKEKSTANKTRAYYEDSYTILNRIGQLPAYREDNNEIKELYQANKYNLTLANVNVNMLARKKNITEIRDYLVSSMKQRE